MAIVFQNDKYHIMVDSRAIIGVMGENYDTFLSSLKGDNIYFLDKDFMISKKKVSSLLSFNYSMVHNLLQEYDLDENILDKNIYKLSHSEQKIIKYLLMILNNKKIIVIDEPFVDLDFNYRKKIIVLLKRLVKQRKTIILGSVHSNDIYSICDKILFINNDDSYYSDVSSFNNKNILKKYNIEMPDLVNFSQLAKEKNVILGEFTDIRDLIKDVYRNVSKK